MIAGVATGTAGKLPSWQVKPDSFCHKFGLFSVPIGRHTHRLVTVATIRVSTERVL